MIGIYKITNLVNGKIYIGQSISIDRRIKDHFYKSFCEKDVSYNSALHNAIRKYGKENFVWKVLQECDEKELDELEKQYIKQYNSLSPNGYNILEGGQKNKAKAHYCKLCGAVLNDRHSTYCIPCGHKVQQKCERPSREDFKNMIRNIPFTKIAEQYGVSDKAICKWCKAYNLPYRKKDIKIISDEDWEKI